MARAVSALALLAALPVAALPQARRVPREALPLRTRGRAILAGEEEVALRCVNWYGSHLRQQVPDGLDLEPLAAFVETIAEMGFNCVRLPFSLDNLRDEEVPEASVSLAANPDLQGLSPLGVIDAVVEGLTSVGLLVVLNIHTSSGGWCCSHSDGEGLWHTEAYPEEAWLDGLALVTERYRGNALVAGFDLRNEVRRAAGRDPVWGGGDADSDWAAAAVRGAEAVLRANEDMLIFISGLDYSMYLCGVPETPVHVQVPALQGRVVYTTHEYSWYHSDLGVTRMLAPLVAWAYLSAVACALVLTALLRARRAQRRACLRRREASAPDVEKAAAPPALRRPLLSGGCGRLRLAAALLSTAAVLSALLAAGRLADPCARHAHTAKMLAGLLGAACVASLAAWVWLLAAVCCGRGEREVAMAAELEEGEQVAPNPVSGSGIAAAPSPPSHDAGAAVCADITEAPTENSARSDVELGGGSRRPLSRRGAAGPLVAPLLAAVVAAGLLGGVAATALRYRSYESFEAELHARWTFLADDGRADAAPVWLGEFGTSTDGLWWGYMTRFLRERPHIGWAYWAINGKKGGSTDESFGLLAADERTVRHPWKLRDLQSLMAA